MIEVHYKHISRKDLSKEIERINEKHKNIEEKIEKLEKDLDDLKKGGKK